MLKPTSLHYKLVGSVSNSAALTDAAHYSGTINPRWYARTSRRGTS